MLVELDSLRERLCASLCANVELHQRPDGLVSVVTPFTFADGDTYALFLKRLPSGGLRLTDMGTTLMHMSYEMDVDRLREGTRVGIWTQVLAQHGVHEDDGEMYIDAAPGELGGALIRLGQALTQLHGLTFLKRVA